MRVNHISEEGAVARTHFKKNSQDSKITRLKSIRNRQRIRTDIIKEGIQIANKHMKKWSTSLGINIM